MARHVFTDFDQFADAISGLNGRYIPTAPSQSPWWINPVRVARLKLQQLQVGAPSAFAGDGEVGELTIGIPLSDPKLMRIDGHALTDNSLILIRRDHPLTYSAPEVTRWAGVTVPIDEDIEPFFLDAAELASATLSETRALATEAAIRPVVQLVAAFCADDEAISIVDPAAWAAAEEEVLFAVSQLLRASTGFSEPHLGRPRISRDRIIARCLEFLSENEGQPILIGDLCRAAQITERTLRSIFYEYFGVGPIRFLKARQLQEVRSELLTTQAQGETVTRIVARFGVWDFSLFARNYRALYGESPSETLRGHRTGEHPPRRGCDLDSLQSWTRYASRYFAHASSEHLSNKHEMQAAETDS